MSETHEPMPVTQQDFIDHDVRRIGIVLLGELDEIPALRMLLLHMNSLQTTVIFELLPNGANKHNPDRDLSDVRLIDLARSKLLREADVRPTLRTFADEYKKRLSQLESNNHCTSQSRLGYVIVSTARFAEQWYMIGEPGTVFIAMGDWKRHMAPPSIVEFIVTFVVRGAAQLLQNGHSWLSHYGTRGCIFDFTDDLREARYQVLEGQVCADCEKFLLEKQLAPSVVADLRRIASRDWLTKPPGRLSPTAVAEALKYDLFLTKGLSPSALQRARKVLTGEAAKEIVKVIFALLLAYIAFRLHLPAKAD